MQNPITAEIVSLKIYDDMECVKLKNGEGYVIISFFLPNDAAHELVSRINTPSRPVEDVGVADESRIHKLSASILDEVTKFAKMLFVNPPLEYQEMTSVRFTCIETIKKKIIEQQAESALADKPVNHDKGCRVFSNASDGTDCNCSAKEDYVVSELRKIRKEIHDKKPAYDKAHVKALMKWVEGIKGKGFLCDDPIRMDEGDAILSRLRGQVTGKESSPRKENDG